MQAASDVVFLRISDTLLQVAKPVDATLLAKYPMLLGELRCATLPLLLPIRAFCGVVQVGTFEASERSAQLLHSVANSIWCIAASLRLSGRGLPITPGISGLVLRLLEFMPKKSCVQQHNDRMVQTVKAHGPWMRNAALGIVSCLDMDPDRGELVSS